MKGFGILIQDTIILFLQVCLCSVSVAQLVVLDNEQIFGGLLEMSSQMPSMNSVLERDWVSDTLTVDSILENHDIYSTVNAGHRLRPFNAVLGYVTPWNSRGYDISKMFLGKFTHIAPLWYRIKRLNGKFILDGAHDVDQQWMNQVRQPDRQGKRALVLPLFQVSEFTQTDWMALIQDLSVTKNLLSVLTKEVMLHGFDGLVIEMSVPGRYIVHIIKQLYLDLTKLNKQLILVIPPRHIHMDSDVFDANDFTNLVSFVDYFSLMTYDYSQSKGNGPNSPIGWIEENIRRLCPDKTLRSKLLTGSNMYGYDFDHVTFNSEPLVGSKYISLLKEKNVILQWDSQSHEHHFTYTDDANHKHSVYYPTLKSFHDRLSLASNSGTGVAIWELGQGLDYFFDII
ncbi:hypothetical protein BDEG_24552 [Batrachochytrium dendrobatidis JEL423]|uniref:Chitinase domain-containing protein 1 n=1 Tax=Batrachochytrium dendrobatidis (strain JEL423) TaxID=403673 RepID=A0A177WL74_BATDL|nr:hypothetical protein BDEG_24552 [Batrachochytrium dendrobatidis JEL423]